jgi:hypothetical protein
MAPVKVDPDKVHEFADAASFYGWLARHHDSEDEVWIKIHKVHSGDYRNGKFPDGAVIVFDLLEANAADGSVTEGKRKVVGVMHRDATKYAATGGWGFEGFAGGSTTQRAVGDQAATACFTCYIAQKQHDYVFSSYRP